MQGEEPVENLVTWVYEEGSYVPVAKIQNGERYTIISDYMGRPVEAYNSYGNVVWQADYDIYGDLRNIKGIRDFIPFLQLVDLNGLKSNSLLITPRYLHLSFHPLHIHTVLDYFLLTLSGLG